MRAIIAFSILATTVIAWTQPVSGASNAAEYAVHVACAQHFKALGASHMHVFAAVAVDGYGACSVGDEHTGGEAVLKLQHGTWKIIGAGGGQFAAGDIEQLYHVPASVAGPLVDKLNAAYAAVRGNH